jgi:hypothetical protein
MKVSGILLTCSKYPDGPLVQHEERNAGKLSELNNGARVNKIHQCEVEKR